MKGPSNGTEAAATADVPATKTETKTKQTPAELLENPYSKLELAVNKKLRNLEKRSQKLVLIKKDQDAGKELTEEQKEAVSKLGEVEIQLEFVRDLQKTITQQTRQYSRAVRQREEGEKKKRIQAENETLRNVLRHQYVFQFLEKDGAKEMLVEGKTHVEVNKEEVETLIEIKDTFLPSLEKLNVADEWEKSLEQSAKKIAAVINKKEEKVTDSCTGAAVANILGKFDVFALAQEFVRPSETKQETPSPVVDEEGSEVTSPRDNNTPESEGANSATKVEGNANGIVPTHVAQEQQAPKACSPKVTFVNGTGNENVNPTENYVFGDNTAAPKDEEKTESVTVVEEMHKEQVHVDNGVEKKEQPASGTAGDQPAKEKNGHRPHKFAGRKDSNQKGSETKPYGDRRNDRRGSNGGNYRRSHYSNGQQGADGERPRNGATTGSANRDASRRSPASHANGNGKFRRLSHTNSAPQQNGVSDQSNASPPAKPEANENGSSHTSKPFRPSNGNGGPYRQQNRQSYPSTNGGYANRNTEANGGSAGYRPRPNGTPRQNDQENGNYRRSYTNSGNHYPPKPKYQYGFRFATDTSA